MDFWLSQDLSASIFARVSEHARVIFFDCRGAGCSDPLDGPWTVEGVVHDALAVMDAAGAQRAILNGYSAGGPVAVTIATDHPERCTALLFENAFARLAWAEDQPFGTTVEAQLALLDRIESTWGTGGWMAGYQAPEVDPLMLEDLARLERLMASPRQARNALAWAYTLDVRDRLTAVQAPTLIFHSHGELHPIEHGRQMAERIAGAELLEIDGPSDWWWIDRPDLLTRWEEFITGMPPRREPTRRLSTILFTDIVGSTSRAAALGDTRWREVLTALRRGSERQVAVAAGRVVKHTGDGLLAIFEAPSDAVRAATALHAEASRLNLTLRAGVHVGEVEVIGDDIGGIAVHVAARVMAEAGDGETFVSGTVPVLVHGIPIRFDDRGEYDLKGVAGAVRLYQVADDESGDAAAP